MAQASAVDGLGQAFPATNNFDLSILGNTICVLSTEVTFIATDNCGRSVSCQQNLQIEDSEPPRVDSCPDDLTVQADDPTLVNVVTNWLDVYSASDQCNSILLLQNDFDSSVLGAGCGSRVVEVIFTADDACFPIDSSCVSTLTIEDNVISSFTTLPEDIILECSTSPDLVTINAWLGQATAGNNLGQTFTVENNLDLTSMAFEMCGADIEVAFSFIDQCGVLVTAMAQIFIDDSTPPTLSCPAAITINADNVPDVNVPLSAWIGSAAISDNCGVEPIIHNYSAQLFTGCEFEITRDITFILSDQCGNQSPACSSALTILADKRPTLGCPDPLTLECGDTSNSSIVQDWIASCSATSASGSPLTFICLLYTSPSPRDRG